jgi:hypothetical protein
MRINVYNEEVTDRMTERIEVRTKTANTGTTFYGLHFYLESPDALHHSSEDDDTSAVVFWGDSPEKLLKVLSKATEQVRKYIETKN